jgi:sugar lactone lactonase YvrE
MGLVRVAVTVSMVAAGCADDGDGEPTCDRCTPVASTLFVADRDGDAVLRYDGTTGAFIDVFAAGVSARVDRPSSVRLGPSGHIYLAGFGRGDIVRYDVQTGAMADIFYWDTILLEEPVELLFRGEELVVLGNDTRNAVVIDPAGVARQSFGPPNMRAAHDFVFGPDGNLYVATMSHPQLGSAIQVWSLETGQLLRHFGSHAELAGATSATMGPDGLLYVCDFDRDQVLRFDPITGVHAGVFVPPGGGLIDPLSLDFGPDGALYVLDAIGVHRLDPDTGDELSVLVRVGDGQLQGPRSFTFVTEAAIAAASQL